MLMYALAARSHAEPVFFVNPEFSLHMFEYIAPYKYIIMYIYMS